VLGEVVVEVEVGAAVVVGGEEVRLVLGGLRNRPRVS